MGSSSEEKTNLILDAAFHLFGTKGFYETKMSEIADEAGIAKGTLYLYFSSKEELFKAMTKRDFEQFFIQMQEQLEKEPSLKAKLTTIALHHLWYFYRRRKYSSVFFQAPNNDPEMMQVIAHYIQQYMKMIEDFLRAEGVKESYLLARAFSGILDAYKMDILFNPAFREADIEPRAEFAVELVMKGMK